MKVQREIDLADDAVVNVDKHATINSIIFVCSGLAAPPHSAKLLD
jgi:hypothetical protein